MAGNVQIVPAKLIKSKIKPVGWVLLVVSDKVAEMTGGIFLPQSGRDMEEAAQQMGVVCAIGELCWKKHGSPWAAVGDRVMFGRYAGLKVKDPATGEDLRLLNDEDIMGVEICQK